MSNGTEQRGRDTLISADDNRRMFDAIARRYDLMNSIISLGLAGAWRRRAAACLDIEPGGRVLDVGTGTGDLLLDVLRRQPKARVIGIDAAEGMLRRAQTRLGRAGVAGQAELHIGDAAALPYADGAFAGVVSAFCLRNVEQRLRALKEMHRVLRPGGKAAILELTVPANRLMRALHQAYSRTVIPLAARLLSRGPAYRYLVDSIEGFPPAEDIRRLVADAGFADAKCIRLTGGVVGLFTGVKV